MVLIYRFKKEKVGKSYVSRPKIPIRLSWKDENLNAIALIDSGADITIVPPEIAEMLKLEFSEEDRIEAYRESVKARRSFVNITFIGKSLRQYVTLSKVPILVPISAKSEYEVILGCNGIFDNFVITFNKSQNKIVLKPIQKESFIRVQEF